MALFAKITVDDIRKSFPTHKITKIEGRPTYATLKPMFRELRKCAESIPSTQKKGHLYLVVDDTEFTTITTDTKTTPVAPPLNASVNSGDTQFVIQQMRIAHSRLQEEYQIHQTVSMALKQLIAENVDEMFLADIEITTSTVLEVINYLRTRYFRITTSEILQNDKIMRTMWDAEEAIEAYFKRFKECVEFAKDAADAEDVTPKMEMQIMLPSMENIVAFKQHVREWKKLAAKTPEIFRTHFIEAYEEMLVDEKGGKYEAQEEANNALTADQLQQIIDSMGTSQNYEHANMSTDNDKVLELLEKLTEKVNALEKRGGTTVTGARFDAGKGRMAWRRVCPKAGEPLEKMVDGKLYKHCQTCRKGEGLWTTGAGMHSTAEHDPEKSRKK